MHTCSECGREFSAGEHSVVPNWKKSTVDRLTNTGHSAAKEIENFGKVKCPRCGHVQDSLEIKAFGLLSRTQLKIAIMLFIAGMMAFAFWSIR